METPVDKKDIRISTFSNSGRWATPVVDIACASFLFSSCAPNMSGTQFNKECPSNEAIESLCNEISNKVYELHKLINQ